MSLSSRHFQFHVVLKPARGQPDQHTVTQATVQTSPVRARGQPSTDDDSGIISTCRHHSQDDVKEFVLTRSGKFLSCFDKWMISVVLMVDLMVCALVIPMLALIWAIGSDPAIFERCWVCCRAFICLSCAPADQVAFGNGRSGERIGVPYPLFARTKHHLSRCAESILVVRELLVQLRSRCWNGRERTSVIDINQIEDVIINEGITMHSVIFYMAFILKGNDRMVLATPVRLRGLGAWGTETMSGKRRGGWAKKGNLRTWTP